MIKNDKKLLVLCVILTVAILGACIYGECCRKHQMVEAYSDGIEQIDLNTIYLEESGVEVSFSEVIIGKKEEVRKLIVSTQEATVSTELSDSLVKIFGLNIGEKKQTVSYTGTGYFIVDLDKLSEDDIVIDSSNRTITIKIAHAYLQTVEVNPDNVIIDEVQKGLLAWGDIKLTVKDYNRIEKELVIRMRESLNTVENAQEADDIALQMVKEIYAPLVKAVDSRYALEVEFK